MTIRVNATDYEGRIVIERVTDGDWAVPAWDEQGCPDLSGPFATVKEAEMALADFIG